MSNKSSNVITKELISIEEQAIMINMENTAETIKAMLDIIKDLEKRLSELDNL